MTIRRAADQDLDEIWRIFRQVVATGDTYVFAADTPLADAREYFLGPGVTSFVAEGERGLLGFYKLIPNRRDRGAHVANASFMVDPAVSGRGIGRALGLHCLREARARGYLAMQFNFVVSTNERAVRLWEDLGFAIDVDAYVMYRSLEDLPWAGSTEVPIFGADTPGYPSIVRPSAYAIAVDASGQIAIVRTEEGVFLPGGGMDPGETAEETAVRETREECAIDIRPTRIASHAVDIVFSKKEGMSVHKRSVFVSAQLIGSTGGPPEHDVMWVQPDAALAHITREGHAWAIRRWTVQS